MSELHLTKGSTKPPLTEGKLRLYSMKFCPYAQRARIVLLLKNIPHDIVNINLRDKPDWFFELNPKGTVPTLETPNLVLSESLDICEYLEKKYPEPVLYPSDEEELKKCKDILKEHENTVRVFYQSIHKKKSLKEYIEDMNLQIYENILKTKETFFGGSTPNIVDYMIWPHAERSGMLSLLFQEKLPVDENNFPAILKWCKAMKELPSVKATITSAERLYKMYIMYIEKTENYDDV